MTCSSTFGRRLQVVLTLANAGPLPAFASYLPHRLPTPPHIRSTTAGLPAPGESLGGWEWRESEVRGQFIGHFLSAVAFAAHSTGQWDGCCGAVGLWGPGPAEVQEELSCTLPSIPAHTLPPALPTHHPNQHHRPLPPFQAGRPEFQERGALMVRELKRVQDAHGNGYLCAFECVEVAARGAPAWRQTRACCAWRAWLASSLLCRGHWPPCVLPVLVSMPLIPTHPPVPLPHQTMPCLQPPSLRATLTGWRRWRLCGRPTTWWVGRVWVGRARGSW